MQDRKEPVGGGLFLVCKAKSILFTLFQEQHPHPWNLTQNFHDQIREDIRSNSQQNDFCGFVASNADSLHKAH